MEKTRRVGILTKRVIELLELELPEGKDILLIAYYYIVEGGKKCGVCSV